MKRIFIATVVLFCTTVVAFAGFAKKKAAPAPKAAPVAQKTTLKAAPAAQKTTPKAAPAARKAAPVTPARKTTAPAAPAKKTVPAVRKVPPAVRTVPAGYRPAGTVAFANLETIARTVAEIPGPKSTDPVLTKLVPNAIRGQLVAKLFGPMRAGAHGVAVCYVDPAIAARVAASQNPSMEELDRAKRWCVVYPTALTKLDFARRHLDVVPEANGALRLPPGRHSRRTLWVWFPPEGQWAVLAQSASMAGHAYGASAAARAHPLGGDLAYIQMNAAGSRVIFGMDLFEAGELSVRMAPRGLELHGIGHKIEMKRPPLPPGTRSLEGVPQTAPLFGVTTTPSDVQVAEEMFTLAGPAFSAYVRKSLRLLERPGATSLYLDEPAALPPESPQKRLARILPESQTNPAAANSFFCSPTTVLRIGLPKVASKMNPLDSAQLHVAKRMLRSARGDGVGAMSWNDGQVDHLLVRISRDELWGTANLWSFLLF